MKYTSEFFLAFRYLKPKRNLVSILTLLSVLGPTLGVAVLIIVISVMAGFDTNIREKILSMQAHIQMHSWMPYIENPDEIIKKLNKYPNIKASPSTEGAILAQTKTSIFIPYLKGIVPKYEKEVTSIKSNIISGTFNIEDDEIIIGSNISSKYGLFIGDKLLVSSIEKIKKSLKFDKSGNIKTIESANIDLPKELTVKGIFSMGMYDYDSSIIFTNIDTANELFSLDWGVATVIKVRTGNPFNLTAIIKSIKKDFPDYSIVTWQEANQQLFGALGVEKKLMFFILFFIVLVSAFGVSGTLISVVVQKTREIGVLKAIGAANAQIMRIFIIQGMTIGSIGIMLGTSLGLIIIKYRNFISDKILARIFGVQIFPEELYHLSGIPAKVLPFDLTVIVFGAMLLCILASLLPACFAAQLSPVNALKNEQ